MNRKLSLIAALAGGAVAGGVVAFNLTLAAASAPSPAPATVALPACAATITLSQPSFATVVPNAGCIGDYSLISYQQPGNIVHDDELLTADAAGTAFLPQCSAFTVTYGSAKGIVATVSGTNTCAKPGTNACKATITASGDFATVVPNQWCLGSYTFASYGSNGKQFDMSVITADGAGNVFLPKCQAYRVTYGPTGGSPVTTLTGTAVCAPAPVTPAAAPAATTTVPTTVPSTPTTVAPAKTTGAANCVAA